jgi:protein TonB
MHTGTGLASAWNAELADRRLRLLALAVLCSLVLHACILLVLSYARHGSPERALTPPLTARLVKPKPPEPVPPLVEPRTRPQPPPPPPRPQPAPVAKARPQPVPQQRPAPAPVPAAPVIAVESPKQAEPALVVPAAPAQPVASADAQPAPAPVSAAATGPDPGSVARFRLELMDIARRYKKYPRIARENNWQGRVELRIAFSASGGIASLNVKKGAGHAVLDEEAQAMIRNAQLQATIPPALRGKPFTLEIPVDFFLTEEEK